MTSLENTDNSACISSNFRENFEPDFIIDDSEAQEINSCLNFLSILDEDLSDDACEYTLFRKKDDSCCNEINKKQNRDEFHYSSAKEVCSFPKQASPDITKYSVIGVCQAKNVDESETNLKCIKKEFTETGVPVCQTQDIDANNSELNVKKSKVLAKVSVIQGPNKDEIKNDLEINEFVETEDHQSKSSAESESDLELDEGDAAYRKLCEDDDSPSNLKDLDLLEHKEEIASEQCKDVNQKEDKLIKYRKKNQLTKWQKEFEEVTKNRKKDKSFENLNDEEFFKKAEMSKNISTGKAMTIKVSNEKFSINVVTGVKNDKLNHMSKDPNNKSLGLIKTQGFHVNYNGSRNYKSLEDKCKSLFTAITTTSSKSKSKSTELSCSPVSQKNNSATLDPNLPKIFRICSKSPNKDSVSNIIKSAGSIVLKVPQSQTNNILHSPPKYSSAESFKTLPKNLIEETKNSKFSLCTTKNTRLSDTGINVKSITANNSAEKSVLKGTEGVPMSKSFPPTKFNVVLTNSTVSNITNTLTQNIAMKKVYLPKKIVTETCPTSTTTSVPVAANDKKLGFKINIGTEIFPISTTTTSVPVAANDKHLGFMPEVMDNFEQEKTRNNDISSLGKSIDVPLAINSVSSGMNLEKKSSSQTVLDTGNENDKLSKAIKTNFASKSLIEDLTENISKSVDGQTLSSSKDKLNELTAKEPLPDMHTKAKFRVLDAAKYPKKKKHSSKKINLCRNSTQIRAFEKKEREKQNEKIEREKQNEKIDKKSTISLTDRYRPLVRSKLPSFVTKKDPVQCIEKKASDILSLAVNSLEFGTTSPVPPKKSVSKEAESSEHELSDKNSQDSGYIRWQPSRVSPDSQDRLLIDESYKIKFTSPLRSYRSKATLRKHKSNAGLIPSVFQEDNGQTERSSGPGSTVSEMAVRLSESRRKLLDTQAIHNLPPSHSGDYSIDNNCDLETYRYEGVIDPSPFFTNESEDLKQNDIRIELDTQKTFQISKKLLGEHGHDREEMSEASGLIDHNTGLISPSAIECEATGISSVVEQPAIEPSGDLEANPSDVFEKENEIEKNATKDADNVPQLSGEMESRATESICQLDETQASDEANISQPVGEAPSEEPKDLSQECSKPPDTDTTNELVNEQKSSISYSFNNSSPLSFLVQNILENMYKYENFPSSTNMARIAKLLEVQWKDVRNWFVSRRDLSKKNGIFPRVKQLITCEFCPGYKPSLAHPMIHLLNRSHIRNMTEAIRKDTMIFSMYQNERATLSENIGGELEIKNEANESKSVECDTNTKNIKESSEVSQKSSVNLPENDTNTNSIQKSSEVKQKPPVNLPEYDSNTKNIQQSSEVNVKSPVNQPTSPNYEFKPIHSPVKVSFPNERLNVSLRAPLKLKENKETQEPIKRLKMTSVNQIESPIYVGYRCPDCGKIFQSEWTLIRHSISHKQLICSECDEVFLREELLQHHIKEHLIESMERALYPFYMCMECSSLDCTCLKGSQFAPPLRTKHYLRPQRARRSRPFLVDPHPGDNEHLKVTMKEFLKEFKSLDRKATNVKKVTASNKTEVKRDKKEKTNNFDLATTSPTYTNITTFNCDLCESFFFTQDELEEHVIVHRIQARNRNKKIEKLEKESSVFLKPAAPGNPLYFCCYCTKGYKRETTLLKHLKFECKALPKNISKHISDNSSFQIERIGKSSNYKVKLKSTYISPQARKTVSKPSKMKCKFCSLEILDENYAAHHLRYCPGKKSERKTQNNKTKKACEETRVDVQDVDVPVVSSKDDYFLCVYCSIPLVSEELLRSHIGDSCSRAPSETRVEVESHSLFELEQLGKGVHYRKLKREFLTEILPLRKVRLLFDTSTFPRLTTNRKRVKCKFCDKTPLYSCLKAHLRTYCMSMPEELRTVLLANKNYIFGKYFKKKPTPTQSVSGKDNILKTSVEKEKIETPDKIVAQIETRADKVSTPDMPMTKHSETDVGNPGMLYDCHLCEDKFKLSKDFISHMSSFHCMKIAEESSYKWLSDVTKRDEQPGEKLSPIKSPLKHDGRILEQEADLECIAETLIVSDLPICSDEVYEFSENPEMDELSKHSGVENKFAKRLKMHKFLKRSEVDTQSTKHSKINNQLTKHSEGDNQVMKTSEVHNQLLKSSKVVSQLTKNSKVVNQLTKNSKVVNQLTKNSKVVNQLTKKSKVVYPLTKHSEVDTQLSKHSKEDNQLTKNLEVVNQLPKHSEVDNQQTRHLEVDNKLTNHSEVHNRLPKHSEVDNQLTKHSEVDNQLTKHSEVHNRLTKHSEVDNQLTKLSEVDNQLRKHSELDNRLTKHSEVDNELMKYSEVEKCTKRLEMDTLTTSLELSNFAKHSEMDMTAERVNKRKHSFISSNQDSPNKSQKMDDELLGDFGNLDNFIETVQLEDSSFENTL